MDDLWSTKTAKIKSLENLSLYGIARKSVLVCEDSSKLAVKIFHSTFLNPAFVDAFSVIQWSPSMSDQKARLILWPKATRAIRYFILFELSSPHNSLCQHIVQVVNSRYLFGEL